MCCSEGYLAGGPPWLGNCSEEPCSCWYGLLGAAAALVVVLLQPVTCSDRDQRGSWDSSEDHVPPFLTDDKKISVNNAGNNERCLSEARNLGNAATDSEYLKLLQWMQQESTGTTQPAE